MDHKIKQETGGKNEMSWIQPVCSCGWIGRKEYAYNDYQHSNVMEQKADHISKAKDQ